MDWNVFWNAFGAIGTTVGTLITAVAVVVAVVQYKQPLIKKTKITTTTSVPIYDFGFGDSYLCITIANTGIRPLIITNIYLNARRKNLIINPLMTNLDSNHPRIQFPIELSPEDSVSVYLPYAKLSTSFSDLLLKKEIRPKQVIKVLATDTTSGKHYCSTKLTAKKLSEFKGL